MKKLLLSAFLLSALLVPAKAADIATKAAPYGYPTTKCGFYYGIGTGGSAVAVNGSVVGTQIIQGELDGLVGYTCPLGAQGFWFVEGSVGYDNLNGSVNGFALSGPLILTQRFGAGSPINGLFNPFNNTLALPSLPALPNGVTAGPANGYLFAGVVEQDISAQVGLSHNKQWLVAPILGVGLLTRLSDGVVVDTWAGWQLNSDAFCPNAAAGLCGKMGNGGRVGVAFKY